MDPRNISLADLDLQRARADIEREKCRRSFRFFFGKAFPTFEPSTALVPNWHIDAICDHLEAAVRGEIKRLLISIPSRHLKTAITTVALLPWVWTWNPAWRGIFASYSDKLSVENSIKARKILESPWYKANFCAIDGWSISEDRNTQDAYTNTAGGHRLSFSVGGKGLGQGANGIVCDDPQTTDGVPSVYSKADRERVIRWWFETMTTRVDRATRIPYCYIVMQQRLHVDDLIGAIIARELGYEYLCLPSEFVPSRRATTYRINPETKQREKFFEDPRTKAGELLFPQIITAEELENDKKGMSTQAYEAQHQQNPISTANAQFKPEMWRWWKPDGRGAGGAPRPDGCLDREECPAVPLPAAFDRMVISVDCSLLGEAARDWTVIQVWGSSGADRYLLRQYRDKIGVGRTCEILKDLAKEAPFAKIIVEEAVVGPAVVEAMQKIVPGVMGVKTQGHGGKEGRAAAILPQVEAGNVFLPEGASWLKAFVDELAAFNNGSNDDQVDALAYALRELTAPGAGAGLPAIGFRRDWGPGTGAGLSGGFGNLPLAVGAGRGGLMGGGGPGSYYGPEFRRRFR